MSLKSKIAMFFSKIIVMFSKIQLKVFPLYFHSEKDTIDKINSGASVCRFGDGEMNIILKKHGIDFQPYNDELSVRLKDVLSIDMGVETDLCIAIVPLMGHYDGYSDRWITFWSIYNLSKRNKIYKILKKDSLYYDALFARMYGLKKYTNEDLQNKISRIRSIWHNKITMIIEGHQTKFGVNNDMLYNAKCIRRILIPDTDAWSSYNKIYISAVEEINNNDIEIILIIAGPTATVLAYDLYKIGVQAIDIGQINESYFDALIELFGKEKYLDHIISEDEYKKQIVRIID